MIAAAMSLFQHPAEILPLGVELALAVLKRTSAPRCGSVWLSSRRPRKRRAVGKLHLFHAGRPEDAQPVVEDDGQQRQCAQQDGGQRPAGDPDHRLAAAPELVAFALRASGELDRQARRRHWIRGEFGMSVMAGSRGSLAS